MKKIILILVVILLCGCNNTNNDIDNDVNNNDNIVENPTKEELLIKEMKETYSKEEYSLISENIGINYFTPLRATNIYLVEQSLYDSCDRATSGYSISINEKNGKISGFYKVYLDCDGKTTIYSYNDLSEDSEPVNVIERVNES